MPCRSEIGLTNLRVLRLELDYAVRYLLPENSVWRFHLNFPDPWPKRRHQTRRVVDGEFLEAIYRSLIDGGELWIKTDHEAYFQQIIEDRRRSRSSGLRWNGWTKVIRAPILRSSFWRRNCPFIGSDSQAKLGSAVAANDKLVVEQRRRNGPILLDVKAFRSRRIVLGVCGHSPVLCRSRPEPRATIWRLSGREESGGLGGGRSTPHRRGRISMRSSSPRSHSEELKSGTDRVAQGSPRSSGSRQGSRGGAGLFRSNNLDDTRVADPRRLVVPGPGSAAFGRRLATGGTERFCRLGIHLLPVPRLRPRARAHRSRMSSSRRFTPWA